MSKQNVKTKEKYFIHTRVMNMSLYLWYVYLYVSPCQHIASSIEKYIF